MSQFEEIPRQSDRVEGWAIQYVIAGVVLAIALCGFVVWLFLGANLVGGGRTNPIVRRTLPPSTAFDSPTPLELARQAQEVQLEHWQWADRAHRRVLEPIDLAIDRYLKEKGAR